MYANVKERFGCIDCGYFTNVNFSIKRHMLSKQHLLKKNPVQDDVTTKHQCKICDKIYKSQQGLWSHNKKCKKEEVDNAILNKIDRLENIILEMTKNQQPTIINNTNNSININITLNEKCGNACNIMQFLENIEFKYEHIDRILSDYVNGNAEIIASNYNALPQLERPFYSFVGEDTEQEIAHIKHDDKWIAEPEFKWEKRIRLGKNLTNSEEDSLPNDSMYSFIRMFDKNKLKFFEEKFLKDDIYKKGRRLESDSCDPDLQSLLIEKLISIAKVDVSILN
jgi:hypothetical protein